jgi:hypothetical protein
MLLAVEPRLEIAERLPDWSNTPHRGDGFSSSGEQ